MKRLLLIFFIFLAVSGYSQKNQNLNTSIDLLKELMLNPTTEGLKSISHPLLTYGHSGGKVENQAEFIEAFISGNSDFTDLKFSEIDVKQIKNTAIVRHILEGTTNDKGKAPGVVKIKVMLVWVKEKGSWKLIGRQAVKI